VAFPARLHVLLARDAPVGVVIRRGPAKSVCTLLWDRRNDTFKLGQWMRGRIYERRCDLSPDGQHFLYFALSGRWSSETRGSYTAISRAPWLKALTLFPEGSTWGGGGLFMSNSEYHDQSCSGFDALRDESGLRLVECSPRQYELYRARLVRDGWQPISEGLGFESEKNIFEKDTRRGWILRKYVLSQLDRTPGKAIEWDEHELEKRDERIVVPSWEWAEVDGRDIVWAEKGCLYRARLYKSGLGEQKMVYDFNDMKFQVIQAPY
jgi:hypothetical protein